MIFIIHRNGRKKRQNENPLQKKRECQRPKFGTNRKKVSETSSFGQLFLHCLG